MDDTNESVECHHGSGLTYFNKSVNSDAYLNINIFRIVIIRKGTTKFRANPVHAHTLHQN